MAKRQVFYSFHYANDVMRVQQIRNMGVLEGNEPVSPNNWEEIKRRGDQSIKSWINDNMNYKSCVVVLVGEMTASRKWVKYEIKKAWEDHKGVVGIYIHNLKDPNTGRCSQGQNPFSQFDFGNKVKCYNPNSQDAYNDIEDNLSNWIEESIDIRNK